MSRIQDQTTAEVVDYRRLLESWLAFFGSLARGDAHAAETAFPSTGLPADAAAADSGPEQALADWKPALALGDLQALQALAGQSSLDHLLPPAFFGPRQPHISLPGKLGDGDPIGGAMLNILFGGPGDDDLTGDAASNKLFGGLGNDVLTGLGDHDLLLGGRGADTYVVTSVSDSTGSGFDVIGLARGQDRIDIEGTITAIADTVTSGSLSLSSFDADLAASIGADAMGAGEAVLFAPDEGGFAGRIFLIADANGEAGYQAGEDYVWQVFLGGGPPLIPLELFI
jgi:hypothetical protein